MKRNKEVAQAFAEGKRATSGNLVSEGGRLWSYNTVVGFWAGGRVFINNTYFSHTTRRHTGEAVAALNSRGVRVYSYYGGFGYPSRGEIRRNYCDKLKEARDKLSRARSDSWRAYWGAMVAHLTKSRRAFYTCELWG